MRRKHASAAEISIEEMAHSLEHQGCSFGSYVGSSVHLVILSSGSVHG
jgi:hypothetical protein